MFQQIFALYKPAFSDLFHLLFPAQCLSKVIARVPKRELRQTQLRFPVEFAECCAARADSFPPLYHSNRVVQANLCSYIGPDRPIAEYYVVILPLNLPPCAKNVPSISHSTQSAINTFVWRGAAALRFEQNTSFLPSCENIGKPSKSSQ